jgi:CBS domain containing-hemolysin-like protein
VLTPLQTIELEAAEALLRLSLLLVLVVVIAFFVAAELAIVSASKGELYRLAKNPDTQAAAQQVQHAQSNLKRYLSVTQTGTTAGSLLLGWLGEGATVHWIEPWIARLPLPHLPAVITTHAIATAIAFLLVTYVEIVLGELVPKVLASQAPERTALLLIRPLQLCAYLFFPALVVLDATVNVLTGWINRRTTPALPQPNAPIVGVDSHSVTVEGAVDLQTLNEQIGINLPASDAYKTVAGFMIHQLGRVPAEYDRVQWGELELEAVRVVENRLEAILLRQITRPLGEVGEREAISNV